MRGRCIVTLRYGRWVPDELTNALCLGLCSFGCRRWRLAAHRCEKVVDRIWHGRGSVHARMPLRRGEATAHDQEGFGSPRARVFSATTPFIHVHVDDQGTL